MARGRGTAGSPRRGTSTGTGGTRIPPPPEVRPPARAPREADVWIDEGPVGGRVEEQAAPKRRRSGPAAEIDLGEFAALVGMKRAKTLVPRVSEAAEAFAAERFPDARRIIRPIVTEAPDSPTARELLGLTQYRLGNWAEAARQLEEFRRLTGHSTEQHPVLADCYRALKRYKLVDELWSELREASPSAELVTEGRIVAAGSLADRGRLADAIRVLERGWKAPRRPSLRHLRRAYALADLYERAGELPRARALFGWIANSDPEFVDVVRRYNSIG